MRFERHQVFGGSVDEVIDVLVDPAFYPRLAEIEHLGAAELVDVAHAAGTVRFSVRYRVDVDLPAAARTWIHPERLSLVEEAELDRGTGTGSFRMVPDHYGHLLHCRGEYRFTELVDGCSRTMSGTLAVRIPLLGGKIERVVLDGLGPALDGIGVAVDARLRDDA